MSQALLGRGRSKIKSVKTLPTSSSIKSLTFCPFKPLLQNQKTVHSIPQTQIQRQVAHYEWRTKTELPIVKIKHFCMKGSIGESWHVEVHVENYPLRLPDLKELPLFKVICLLKEALIGFERLFQRFGPFLVSPKMVGVDRAGKCRVWVCQDFTINKCVPCSLGADQLVRSIYSLFQKVTNAHKTTQIFFNELNYASTFCGALQFIDNYTKAKKITVPNCWRFDQKQVISRRKLSYGSQTMSISPKFINSLRNTFRPLSRKLPFLIHEGSINEREEQTDAQIKSNMKVTNSEHTTADIPSKQEKGLQVQDQSFFQNLLENPTASLPLVRSHHHHIEQNNAFRKLSEQFPSIKCFGAQVSNRSPSKQQKQARKWQQNHFVSCEGEKQQASVKEQRQLALIGFKNWEKTLSGLFEGGNQMKKSIHTGRQQREALKFQLLDNLGKAIKQSFIHEDLEQSNQY